MSTEWHETEGSSVKFQVGSVVPKQGEIRNIRHKTKGYIKQIIWLECPKCKKSRWVNRASTYDKSFTGYCDRCYRTNKNKLGWRKKDARYQLKKGYVYIRLYSEDFFYQMAGNNGYVAEHRLVVAKALGRNLHRWEVVHHKGTKYPKGSREDKADNRYPENLQLVTDDRHRQITLLENRIKFLEGLLSEAGIPFNHRQVSESGIMSISLKKLRQFREV